MRLPRTPRLIALGIVPLVVAGALVAPSAVAEPRKSIDEVQAELDALETKAEMAQEQYNGAQAKLDKIRKLEDAARAKVKSARTRLAAQQEAIGEIVSSAYRAGGIDVSVQLLMADDPQDFLRQATAVDQLAANQSAALRKTQSARLALAQATATLAQQEQSAEALVKEMADRKAEVDAAVAETLTVLENLKEEERKRLAAIAAAKKAAADKAAADARARAAAEADRSRDSGSSSDNGSSDDSDSDSGSSGGGGYSGGGSSSERAAIAVDYALAQVGEPYSYSASPPSSWDCSKLTSWAWKQAGVYLTPYSYDQANEVRRISTDDLQPGDILFYFNNAHHVAMYIGGGQIVEASSPRTGVRVTDVWNSWSASHFSFAGRPLG